MIFIFTISNYFGVRQKKFLNEKKFVFVWPPVLGELPIICASRQYWASISRVVNSGKLPKFLSGYKPTLSKLLYDI